MPGEEVLETVVAGVDPFPCDLYAGRPVGIDVPGAIADDSEDEEELDGEVDDDAALCCVGARLLGTGAPGPGTAIRPVPAGTVVPAGERVLARG